DDVQTSF
nr:Chain B, PBM [Homo sapiens]